MSLKAYLRKMRGAGRGSPPRVGTAEIAWSWLGAFVGIAAVAGIGQAVLEGLDLTLMLGPLILLAVALVVNNLPASRRYPETWF